MQPEIEIWSGNMKNTFLEKLKKNVVDKLFPDPFSKNSKLIS